ncbi:hypothetical protein G9A89_011904 [Geosiphon pyriformis]|nr:hypothetical protein G9A89_011904 [Geosiphon pyriformis]
MIQHFNIAAIQTHHTKSTDEIPVEELTFTAKPEDFQSPRNLTQQQEPISTSANIIDYLQENESNHSESLESEETESEPEKITENEEEMATAYIAKIPEFTSEDNNTSLQEWLDKVQKAGDANDWIAARMLKAIPYFLQGTARECYEMAMEEANHTKLVNLAIRETSLAAEEKIDQLTKKVEKKSDFQQTALSEGEVAAPRSNPSNHTIPPAQIAQNANLLDIFSFEFEANESSFLLSNTAVNEQKAITAMYTEATVEEKLIHLILDSGLAETLVGNDWLLKANANLNWETQELKISYQGQYTIVLAICGIFNKQSEKAPVFEFEEEKEMPLIKTYMALGLLSNWAKETEQEIFKESRGWKKIRYSIPEPRKEPPYILLKCKDCKKKLSSMRACISLEEEYETHTCYFYKTCHRE